MTSKAELKALAEKWIRDSEVRVQPAGKTTKVVVDRRKDLHKCGVELLELVGGCGCCE